MRIARILFVLAMVCPSAFSQRPDDISISSATVLDAAGPRQRLAIRSVYLVGCKSAEGVGTGFLLKIGVLVTNQHVVGTCPREDIVAIAPDNTRVSFTKVVRDENRDLALLKPSIQLRGGLELGDDKDPLPGKEVSTWGYPLLYNGIQPLLSVGYVAGFRNVTKGGETSKHLIVNGAFNHGNSGGPLMAAHDNHVIGVVVATYHFFPDYVEKTIETLQAPGSTAIYSGRFTKLVNGKRESLSDAQVVGIILQEFYDKTQVMIGEAISVSELRKYLKENATEMGLDSRELRPDTTASRVSSSR